MTTPLAKSAAARRQDVVNRIHRAMRVIEQDVEQNEGIYPLNKGRITQAEVCRKAGVAQATLQGVSHKDTTLLEINAWLEQVKNSAVHGRSSIRKEVLVRVLEGKDEIIELRQRLCEAEVEIEELNKKIIELS